MQRKYYTFIFLMMLLAIILVPIFFCNNWILKHNAPGWLRAAIYILNPPDKLRSAIQAVEIVEGDGDVSYINEYYGQYSIYIAKDISGREFVRLESVISYQLTCKDYAKFNAAGNLGELPQPILIYTVPVDVPIGGKLSCTIRIKSKQNEKQYVIVNKLFDV
jgi:hypothetical protein